MFYSSIWGLLSYSFYTFWPSVATENLVAKWATHSQRAVPCAALSKKSLTFAQKKVRMFRMRHKMLREVSWIYMDLLQLIFPFLCFPSVFFCQFGSASPGLDRKFAARIQPLQPVLAICCGGGDWYRVPRRDPGERMEGIEETHYRAMKDWTSCFFLCWITTGNFNGYRVAYFFKCPSRVWMMGWSPGERWVVTIDPNWAGGC